MKEADQEEPSAMGRPGFCGITFVISPRQCSSRKQGSFLTSRMSESVSLCGVFHHLLFSGYRFMCPSLGLAFGTQQGTRQTQPLL